MPTILQNVTAVGFAGASTVSATFGSNLTSGTRIVAVLSWDLTSVTATVADNANAGNYTIDSAATSGGADGKSSISSKSNTGTTAAVVTATLSATTHGRFKVYELSASELDVAGNGGGEATPQTVSITTLTANCSVFACSTVYPAGNVADTNYTLAPAEVAGNSNYHTGEYRADAGAAGGITLTFGRTGNLTRWSLPVAAYKTASVAAFIFPQRVYQRAL